MLGRFLQPDAIAEIAGLDIDPLVKGHAMEVIAKGYTVVRGAIPAALCQDTIAAFRRFERANDAIFAANRDASGHYPRIQNLHAVLPELDLLFTRNPVWLAVQDVLFGAPTALYTSLFYEVGSQQPLHRDSPVFATRPEYLYFGTTVYLEPADDDNGCLEVMQGGHLIPEIDREALALRRYGALDKIPNMDGDAWMEYQASVVEAGRARRLAVRKLHVQAGDSLIWHPQLPHGGTAIRDATRSRLSFVMHTTPVGVPVYHQDVFFAPSRPFPDKAPWTYREAEGRRIADFRHGVGFGHERAYQLAEFRQPELVG
jgi:ectoine hydroxylase-related dioxygenase (phytanoyl-CoA dioxygenase family)